MITKQVIHKLFLLISAAIILHGTSGYLIVDGAFSTRTLDTYTILSNLLVAFGFLTMTITSKRTSVLWSYLSFAMLVCISFTGLVYNFVLVPFGGHDMVFTDWPNFVTHLLSVVLVIVNYFVFERKGTFTYRHIILAGLLPTILYWTIFVVFGQQLNFNHYFFMMPTLIGWSMVFFWFVLLIIFFIGLSIAIMLFDNGRRLWALGSLLLGSVICMSLAIIFYTPVRTVLHIVIPVENVLESDNIEFWFSPFEAGQHSLDLTLRGEGVVTSFRLMSADREIIFYTISENFSSIVNVELDYGMHVLTEFFTDYESLVSFFESEGLGEISPQESEYFREVFGRDGSDYSAYFSIRIW